MAAIALLIRGLLGLCTLGAARSADVENMTAPRSPSLAPAFSAAKAGIVADLRAAVQAGFDVNAKSNENITCLQASGGGEKSDVCVVCVVL